MQVNKPELTAAPSGKYSGMPDYIAHAIQMVGSAKSLARLIGLTTGSRVSDWRAGYGAPSVLMALRLARITGDDPIDVLIMANHAEEVEELKRILGGTATVPVGSQLLGIEANEKLQHAIRLIQRAAEALEPGK